MQVSKSFKRVVLLELAIPVGFLLIGLYHGLIHITYRAGILITNPEVYQPVTAGNLLYGFIPGIFFSVVSGHVILAYYSKTEPGKKSMWAGLILMITGLILMVSALLSVDPVKTDKPPFFAVSHPFFYIGLLILLTGSCVPVFSWIQVYRQWKKDNEKKHLPLAVAGILTGAIAWLAGSMVVAGAFGATLVSGLPGQVPAISIPLSGDLFLYADRVLPYFWLMPVFIIFYTLLPQVAGGKLYAEPAARISLFSFFLFFIPIDVFFPAYPFRELSLIIPCFIASFIVIVSLEYAGRQNGAAKGLFNWIERLPYFDDTKYLFAYGICAFLLFTTGGINVLVNSFSTVRHTANHSPWVAEFYMIVAGPALPVMAGISLFLYTTLSGKKVSWPRLNVTLPYLWTMGILILSLASSWDRLLSGQGLPTGNPIFHPDWIKTTTLVLLGQLILLVTGIIFFLVVLSTALSKKTQRGCLQLPLTTTYYTGKQEQPWHRLTPWLLLTAAAMMITGLLFLTTDVPAASVIAVQNIDDTNLTQPISTPPLPVKQDYGLLLGFLASVGVFILILLFCVQTSGLQRKLRSQKSSFPG